MKQKLLNKLWLRVGMIVAIMTTALSGAVWAESYNVTYNYSDLKDLLSGSYEDANSYWKVPGTAGNAATIAIPISNQPTSDITITFNIATFGQGTNPSSSNTTITAVGTESNSNWSGSGVSSYPSSSTYVNGVMTITKPDNPTTLSGLTITMGVNSGIKIFRLKSITVSYTYDGGTPTPTTYTVTYDCNGATSGCPNDETGITAGTSITLAAAPTKTDYTFDGWNDGTNTYQAGDSYTVNSDVTMTAQWTANGGGGGETITFDFEDDTAHRTSGNNSYSSNTYSENGVNISLTYADAVTSGSPLNGFANVMGRIAKNTTNSPVVLIGPIDISSKIITSIAYKTKGVAAMSQVFETSLDNSNWTTQLSLNAMPTQATTESVSDLSITGTQLYLKWTVSVSSATNSNRDFNLDDIVITYTESSNPVPSITASNVEIDYNSTSGSFDFTISNPVDGGTTTVSENVDWISNAAVSGNSVTFNTTANEATTSREGAITLTYTYGEENITKEITVTQAGNPNGPGTENNPYTVAQALAAPTANGVYVTGIISTITEVSTEHGNATYRISDDGTTTNEMIIYRGKYLEKANFTSADQIHVGDVVVVTGNLSVYNEVNQLAQGNHLVSIESNSTTPIINATDVTLAYDATSGEITYSITNPADGVTLGATTDADWVSGINVNANKVTFSTTANETGSVRTATFTLTYTGATDKTVTVTQAKQIVNGNYTLATTITSGKSYVIVGEHEGTYYVMGEQASNNRHGVEATVTAGVLSVSNEYEFVIAGNDTDGYTIYDGNGYLYAASSSANQLKTQATNNTNGIWTISIDGSASVVAAGSENRNVMQFNYNGGSPIFSCYASASQAPVYLFEKVEPYAPETRTLNGQGYATFASTSAVDFDNTTGCTAWAVTEVDGTSITFTQVIGTVAAGTGVLLKGEANATVTFSYSESAGVAVGDNLLEGITSATPISGSEGNYEYYGLSGKSFVPLTTGTVQAGRALLPASALGSNNVKAFTFVFEDDATGISLMEDGRSQMEDGVIYNLAGQRTSKMQKGINIVNGKKILK